MRKILSLDYYAFYLALFALPFGKSIFVPILFGWLCAVFLSYFIKRDYSFNWFRGLLILPVIFYLLQLIGLATSKNFNGGLFDMQLKLSLILLPIFYPTQRGSYRVNKQNFLVAFVLGCVVAAIYYFGYAFYRSYEFVNGIWVFNPIPKYYYWNNYFLSSDFSYLIHPSYLALYLLVAILIIGVEFNRWRRRGIVVKVFVVFGSLILLTSLILLQSRAGILGFGLLALVWLFYLVFAKRKFIIGVSIMVVLIGLTYFVFTKFDRFENTAKSLETTAEDGMRSQGKEDGTMVRFWIWSSVFSVLKEHPILGVGTGDVRDELHQQYESRGMVSAAEMRFNAHNQYLETWLGTGIFGLLALLAMLFIPLWVGLKRRDWLLVGFLCLCGTSFMFESMLNTIMGVGFFAIFYTILVSNLAIKNTTKAFG